VAARLRDDEARVPRPAGAHRRHLRRRRKVAVRLRFRGTHSGEFLGFHPTGRTIEYVSHEFYRIADGLIVEEWICSDMATLLSQLS
jgi:predicted ester cyclase